MRGTERFVVGWLLLASASLTGALAGFAAGIGASAFDVRVPLLGAVAGAALALILDAFAAPPAVRRQVPQLWGRIFSARTTALLYGARLGVGPLTILRTWWWWLAFVLGALAGPWPSAAVGATFAVARVAVMLAAGGRTVRPPPREKTISGSVASLAVAAVAAIVFVAPPISRAANQAQQFVARCTDACIEGARATSDAALAPVVTAPEAASLAEALPAEIEAGFARVSDESGFALGALDLARAASAEGDESAERALLETRHFLGGHARAWRATDGRLAYAAAYMFASSADAIAYLGDGFITLEGRGARVYDLAAPVGARGFSQAASGVDGADVAHGVAFVRDETFFLVFVTARSSDVSVDDARRIARLVDGWQGAH